MRIKTLICKLSGVIFSVAGGLPCGKEGPMVHSGACIAAGVSQGKSSSLGFDLSFDSFQDFRNDGAKRDFVACGATAGVCTAFQAPIGGVLFALEEGTSHWSSVLTWQTFFCSMTSLTTLYWVKEIFEHSDYLNSASMFSFGEFFSLAGEEGGANYDVWELTMFFIIGGLGGVIGAAFNQINKWITVQRKKLFGFTGTISAKSRSMKKFLEAMVIAFLMTIVSFCFPLAWGCRDLPSEEKSSNWTAQETQLIDSLVQFQCKKGEYNELASLFFTEQDTAIRHLFHFRELGDGELADATFSMECLVAFFLSYTAMSVMTYGLAVPSGLFVPSLLSGAAFGRLCGHLLHRADSFNGTFADAGTYALIGAVAVLGGMARMTISLTVIMLEATGDMQYVLPLMITLLAARWTGNIFNEGLYDIHIHLNKLPLLEHHVPKTAQHNDICVREIMSATVTSLTPVMRVEDLYNTVIANDHECFPVVRPSDERFQGTIDRKRVAALFQHEAFGPGHNMPETYECDGSPTGRPNRPLSAEELFNSKDADILSPLLPWVKLEKEYPRYPSMDDFTMKEMQRGMVVDLRPYVNTSPYTLHESASVRKTYRLFTGMALRHLCILDHEHRCVGLVTRHDLLDSHIKSLRTNASTSWVQSPQMKSGASPFASCLAFCNLLLHLIAPSPCAFSAASLMFLGCTMHTLCLRENLASLHGPRNAAQPACQWVLCVTELPPLPRPLHILTWASCAVHRLSKNDTQARARSRTRRIGEESLA